MFANNQMMGTDTGTPDVCLTPDPVSGTPIPIPYSNVASGPMGVGGAYNVLMGGAPTHNLSTTIPLTNGDNAGIATGVASGTVMGPARHLTAANTVLVGGVPATRMSSASLQNNTNCPGSRLTPSQLKVLLLAP